MIMEGKFIADRYEVLARVGAGGMSDVYKAKDHVLGRFVAIKVLKAEFANDVNFVTKFRTEAQSAASLEHPNIVNIYDVGSEEGFHYIVMEYVEGITLKTYIEKKGKLTYKEAISIAIQVGRGIEAAHNKNIVHRDIKPQNIMISTEGKVKVTDFGIARAATSNTINSDVMGSVHYTSPEQARNGFVDGKSDIYSLGIVMYEMVTGQVPFDRDTTVAIAIQHLQEEMVSPKKLVPDLPVSLEKIILKCTQKSADRRYAAIDELLADLKHALMSPDEDFVVIGSASPAQGKTRVISEDEVRQIKEETAGVSYQPGQEETKNISRKEEEEEEEHSGILNPRLEKAMTIMGIVAAVIILILIIYLGLSMLGILKFAPSSQKKTNKEEITVTDVEDETQIDANAKEVKMISLKGMDYEEAQKKLEEMNLRLYNLGKESSDEYEEGQIISQSVEAGISVPEGTMIKVTISSGTQAFTVPYVVGSTLETATSTLQGAGLVVVPAYEYSDQPEGTVIAQSPGQGSDVVKGDTVTIMISQGQQKIEVPSVASKTEEEARAALEELQLSVGTVTSDYSETIEEGCIISQSVSAGTQVEPGTTVDLVVSMGKKQVYYQLKNKTIGVPDSDEVVFANITLQDANGTVVESWNGVSISSFPYTISTRDISTSSGTIVIEWVLEDEDGNQSTSTQTEAVSFDQQ